MAHAINFLSKPGKQIFHNLIKTATAIHQNIVSFDQEEYWVTWIIEKIQSIIIILFPISTLLLNWMNYRVSPKWEENFFNIRFIILLNKITHWNYFVYMVLWLPELLITIPYNHRKLWKIREQLLFSVKWTFYSRGCLSRDTRIRE